MTKTTEELINEDGVLDEKAAGEMIDEKMKQMNDELAEVAAVENDTLPPTDDNPVKEDTTADDDDSGGDEWSSEDMQELIESLGYSEEDMSEFSSTDEFKTHVRLMDRELKRTRPGDEQERALEADEISRQKAERSDQVDKQYRENGKFAKAPEELPKLDPDEFDERLIEVLEARDAKIAELEEKLNGTSQNAILQDFDNLVDGLGYDELFGNSEDLKPSDRKQRARLFEEYKEMYNHLEAKGKPVAGKKANRAIVLRALNLEFADELKTKNRRDLTKKAKRQASRITGSARRLSEKKYDGPVEKDPSLLQAFKEMEAENG